MYLKDWSEVRENAKDVEYCLYTIEKCLRLLNKEINSLKTYIKNKETQDEKS